MDKQASSPSSDRDNQDTKQKSTSNQQYRRLWLLVITVLALAAIFVAFYIGQDNSYIALLMNSLGFIIGLISLGGVAGHLQRNKETLRDYYTGFTVGV